MRSLTKRLTVKNDGFCKSNLPAQERVETAVNNYVSKMVNKGWIPTVGISTGNAMFEYEAYVRMCKPSETERDQAVKDAIDNGWSLNDGKWSL